VSVIENVGSIGGEVEDAAAAVGRVHARLAINDLGDEFLTVADEHVYFILHAAGWDEVLQVALAVLGGDVGVLRFDLVGVVAPDDAARTDAYGGFDEHGPARDSWQDAREAGMVFGWEP
jgi:hypothetical protein